MFFKNNARQIKELRQGLERLSTEIEGFKGQNSIIKAMLGSMAEGVIAVDKNTRIVSVNSSAEKIFKIERGECEGRLFLEAIRNNDIIGIINDVLKKQIFISKELALVLPVQKVFQVNASPLFEKNEISGCLVVIHDITEIRRLEDKENNRQFLKIIQDHTERLDSLVNDLLVLSHLESKEITFEKKRINLRPQAEKIIVGFKSQLKKKGVKYV